MPSAPHITRDNILDGFWRGTIYAAITTQSGVHYSELRRRLGLSNGTVEYHLRVLEKRGLVQSRRDGRKRRYYPRGFVPTG